MPTLPQRLIDGRRDFRVVPVTNVWLGIDEPGDLSIDISLFWKPSAQKIESHVDR